MLERFGEWFAIAVLWAASLMICFNLIRWVVAGW